MKAMRFYFSRRSSAFAGLLLYVMIDMLQNLQQWVLERQDWSILTARDFWILGNGMVLSALLLIKSHISPSWHKPNPTTPQNANPQ